MSEPNFNPQHLHLYPQEQVDLREAKITEVLLGTVGFKRFLITDSSSLSDFMHCTGWNVPDPETPLGLDLEHLPAIQAKLLKPYGIALCMEDCFTPLWQLIDKLEAGELG